MAREGHTAPYPLGQHLSSNFLPLFPSPVYGTKEDDGLGFLRVSLGYVTLLAHLGT